MRFHMQDSADEAATSERAAVRAAKLFLVFLAIFFLFFNFRLCWGLHKKPQSYIYATISFVWEYSGMIASVKTASGSSWVTLCNSRGPGGGPEAGRQIQGEMRRSYQWEGPSTAPTADQAPPRFSLWLLSRQPSWRTPSHTRAPLYMLHSTDQAAGLRMPC